MPNNWTARRPRVVLVGLRDEVLNCHLERFGKGIDLMVKRNE